MGFTGIYFLFKMVLMKWYTAIFDCFVDQLSVNTQLLVLRSHLNFWQKLRSLFYTSQAQLPGPASGLLFCESGCFHGKPIVPRNKYDYNTQLVLLWTQNIKESLLCLENGGIWLWLLHEQVDLNVTYYTLRCITKWKWRISVRLTVQQARTVWMNSIAASH